MKKLTQNKLYITMLFVFLIVLGMSFNNFSKATYQKNIVNSGVVSNTHSSKLSSSSEWSVRYGESRVLSLPESFYDCTVSVADEDIASIELDNSAHTITIVGKKIGNTTFTLTNLSGETITCMAHIYSCSSIVPSKSTYTVYLGSTINLDFSVYPENGNCRVSYAYPNSFASCFSISADKIITPKKAGNYYFYLFAEDEEEPMCKCNLIIKAPYFSKTSYTVSKNKSVTLSLYGKNSATTFSSSNKSIATVDKNGVVKGLKAGTVTITANTNGYKVATKVVVKEPTLSVKSKTIVTKQTYTLKVNYATGKVKWKSSNSKVVKVASNGKITGIKAGNATITATVNGKQLKCKVNVKANQKTYKVNTNAASYNYGKPVCRLSKIAYSGNNIVADVWVMNNRMFYAKKFTSINMSIYDSKGKVIANKTFKNINLKLGAYKSKKLKFTFTGGSVKNKKAILNNGVDVAYSYYYIYNV